MNVWEYISTSTGASLSPTAILTIIVSAFLAIGGIALIVVPKEFANWPIKRTGQRSYKENKEGGRRERELRAELRVKVGIAIVLWSGALILSLLLRLLGTPGLETRLLTTIVFLLLPLLVGYIIVYRFFLYPRYLEISRRIDTRKSYVPVKKSERKKTVVQAGKEKVSLMPGKALIGAATLPIVYYLVMTAVNIPPGVPAQNHDHLLHQLGMPILGLLGYTIGLAISLGDELRPLLPWLQSTRK